jgi:hypothetical protein
MFRRGRPGLIGTVARTAVVVGTVNAVGRRSQERAVNEQQAAAYRADQAAADQAAAMAAPVPAAAPPVSPGTELINQLTELGRLRDAGVLTPEEFDATKAKLLATV